VVDESEGERDQKEEEEGGGGAIPSRKRQKTTPVKAITTKPRGVLPQKGKGGAAAGCPQPINTKH
jgi:hypothetical protein